MHVVLVHVTVRADMLSEFEQAIRHNASESVRRDPGCLRFDVIQQYDDPTRWIFYEVYTDRAAHQAHEAQPHTATFLSAKDVLLSGSRVDFLTPTSSARP